MTHGFTFTSFLPPPVVSLCHSHRLPYFSLLRTCTNHTATKSLNACPCFPKPVLIFRDRGLCVGGGVSYWEPDTQGHRETPSYPPLSDWFGKCWSMLVSHFFFFFFFGTFYTRNASNLHQSLYIYIYLYLSVDKGRNYKMSLWSVSD